MKVGILTLPLTDNYGGIMQCVALYRYLQSNGHEVTLINKDFYQETAVWKKIANYILIKLPFHDFKNVKSNYIKHKEKIERSKVHKSFITNEIYSISEKVRTYDEIKGLARSHKFDAVIVGSDQVWRRFYIQTDRYYQNYFLDFLNDEECLKISYAPSFGKNGWEGKNDVSEISKLLMNFDAVSVRESSGLHTCEQTFGLENIQHVLDPTLLMNENFYKSILNNYDVSSINSKGLVSYVLDEAKAKEEIIKNLESKLNLKDKLHLKGFGKESKYYSIPEWIFAISESKFVVTDSFHGMVFSIIFKKDFIVIGNADRGLERFVSLLSILGLEDRLVGHSSDLEYRNIVPIDYVEVEKVLQRYKTKSIQFLEKALSDEKY